MAGLRQVLAVGLGLVLGVLCVAFPQAVIRLQTAGRVQGSRRGPYGEDGEFPATWTWVVRALGVACLAVAGYVAVRGF